MPLRRRTVLLLLLLLGAGVYGALDPLQRARLDRGLKRHRTDFTVYQAAAKALAEGRDPYEAESPRGYRYVYPPLLAVLLMPLADLDPPWALAPFFALSVLALLAALLALARLPGVGGRATVLGVLAAAPFLHQSFERGQVTVLLLAAQVGATVLLVRRREGWAGALLGLGGALRLTPLLLAAAVGLGALAAVRSRGWRPLLHLSGGLLAALVVAGALVPAVALGPARALDVHARWLDRTGSLYAAAPGEYEDLGTVQGINEWRFKNQSPRRVAGTWLGWVADTPFVRERPTLSHAQEAAVDVVGWGVAGLAALLALGLGWWGLRDPSQASFLPVLAVAGALHLFAQRYTWPTHLTALLPALVLAAVAAGRTPRRAAALATFVLGLLAFYGAHALDALQPLAAAGCLALAAGVLLLGVARGATPGRDAS